MGKRAVQSALAALLLSCLFTFPAWGQNVFYFPQIGDGVLANAVLKTSFFFINTGPDTRLSVEILDSLGNPMAIALGTLGQGSSFEIPIKNGESFSAETLGTGAAQTGYTRVTAGSGVGGTAVLTQQNVPTASAQYEFAVPASSALSNFSLFVDSLGNKDTGLVLVNTGNGPANIALKLYDKLFKQVAAANRNLPRGNQWAGYVGEIFTNAAAQAQEMEGTVVVQSDQPLAAATVRQNGTILTSFPIVAGSSSPTLTSDFTPPTGRVPGSSGYDPRTMRLMSAISTDGLNFTRTNRVVTDQGDVPDLVVDSRGWIYLYYVGWTLGSEQHKTVVAISTDGGRNWIYKKAILQGFEGMTPVDPDVQLLSDGTFRIYLTWDPHDGQGPRTYYAEGTDGISFTRKGVAFTRPGQNVFDPSTLLVGSTWHLFAGGNPGTNWHATSSDGRTFTFSDEAVFAKDGTTQAVSNLIPAPSGFRMYTFSHGQNPLINSFFSTNGLTWTPEAGTRLRVDTTAGLESWGVRDAAVVRLADSTYFMVYATLIP